VGGSNTVSAPHITAAAESASAAAAGVGEADAVRSHLLVALSLAYALLACGLSITAALPELRRVAPMSDTVTSLHGSFFGWGMVGGGFVGATVLRAVGRRRVLVGGVIGIASGSATFATARSPLQSLAGAAVIGICGAAVVLTTPALVADVYGEHRARVFNRINTAPAIAGLLFPLALTMATTGGVSWRVPVAVLPIICALSIVVVVARGPLREAHRVATPVSAVPIPLVPLLRNAPLRRRFGLQVLSVAMEFAMGVWVVTYLREEAGFSRSAAPLGAAAWALGMLASRAMVPMLVAALRRRLEACCYGGTAAAVLVLLAAPWPVVKLGAVAAVAFSVGPMYTLGVDRLFVRGGSDSASISALASLASGVAVTVGPVVLGAAADRVGLSRAMLAVVVAAGIGMMLSARRWGGEAGMLGQVDAEGRTRRA
jgi:MFS family permease